MERLTEKHYLGTDHYMKCSGNCNVDMDCIDCPSFDRLVERLAAYEDTGLEPKQCENAKIIIESAFSDDTSKAERIRELLKADKAGRVVVLPCKVGDVVYGFHVEKTILPMVAKWIETNTDGWCIAVQYTPMPPRFYRFSDFGKTVFLTREEAEKALQEMEGKA